LVGCSGASWRSVRIDSEYQPPARLAVVVVAPPGLQTVSNALASGIMDGLASRHIPATLIMDGSEAPDARLAVVKWDPGSRGLRGMVGFGAGKGEVYVSVEATALGLEGTAHGWVTGGWWGGADENSAAAAGHLIAETIATGRARLER
jgi:hypothetical protein